MIILDQDVEKINTSCSYWVLGFDLKMHLFPRYSVYFLSSFTKFGINGTFTCYFFILKQSKGHGRTCTMVIETWPIHLDLCLCSRFEVKFEPHTHCSYMRSRTTEEIGTHLSWFTNKELDNGTINMWSAIQTCNYNIDMDLCTEIKTPRWTQKWRFFF